MRPCLATSNSSNPNWVGVSANARTVSPGGSRCSGGAPTSITKWATGREVRGDVLEARHLRVLGGQVVDRVEDEVGERERAPGARRREVTDHDRKVGASRLRAQARDHGAREIDAVDLHTALRERQRDPPGADPELERG